MKRDHVFQRSASVRGNAHASTTHTTPGSVHLGAQRQHGSIHLGAPRRTWVHVIDADHLRHVLRRLVAGLASQCISQRHSMYIKVSQCISRYIGLAHIGVDLVVVLVMTF
jgi:hypothetical protein